MERLETDVLVAGGGVTGLMAALRAQQAGARVILLQGTPGQSNRISSLSAPLSSAPWDEPAAFFNDILVAGGFLNHPALVTTMVERITGEIHSLETIGIPFRREGIEFARRQASGSSRPWAIFTDGMMGRRIGQALLGQLHTLDPPLVNVIGGAQLLDLRVEDGTCDGGLVYLPAKDRWLQIDAPSVILATGGAGQLFGTTTNPPGSRGIGHILALEAGACLIDLEFVSYEPFIVAAPAYLRGRDLPTTVLREGACLRNGRGEEFLDTASAPSKDVICRAMVREVREGRGTPSGAIYYDLRSMAPERIQPYTQIITVLKALGARASDAQLEVMPAEHCVVGGVRIDRHAATEIFGLYAAGEVTGGVHGAHRLATCGGTEALSFGAVAGESAATYALTHRTSRPAGPGEPRPELIPNRMDPRDRRRAARIRAALDRGCGILRDEETLQETVSELNTIWDDLAAEGRLRSAIGRMTLLARGIAQPALARTESRGDHYRTDHPCRDDARWLVNLSSRYDSSRAYLGLAGDSAGLSAHPTAPIPVHPSGSPQSARTKLPPNGAVEDFGHEPRVHQPDHC